MKREPDLHRLQDLLLTRTIEGLDARGMQEITVLLHRFPHVKANTFDQIIAGVDIALAEQQQATMPEPLAACLRKQADTAKRVAAQVAGDAEYAVETLATESTHQTHTAESNKDTQQEGGYLRGVQPKMTSGAEHMFPPGMNKGTGAPHRTHHRHGRKDPTIRHSSYGWWTAAIGLMLLIALGWQLLKPHNDLVLRNDRPPWQEPPAQR